LQLQVEERLPAASPQPKRGWKAIRDLFVQNPPIEEIIARLYHTE